MADLFLDTLPVNAHTTASDALWAGLPVVTCAGETFIARVCGSLLKAVGLGELITYSLEEYEAMALRLANNLEQLEEFRQRLARNKSDAPLFNIARYTRGLEAAFEHMADIRADGNAPRAFSVTEIDEPDEQPRQMPPIGGKACARHQSARAEILGLATTCVAHRLPGLPALQQPGHCAL